MKRENIFYTLFILTILILRLGVFLFPKNTIVLSGVHINHFWIGILLLLAFLLIPRVYAKIKLTLFSIGLGIISDELVFMLLGGGTVSNYWSIYSILGVILLAVIIFVTRKRLSGKFKNN